MDALRDAILGRPWIPPDPAPAWPPKSAITPPGTHTDGRPSPRHSRSRTARQSRAWMLTSSSCVQH